jgi:hypothetical protein
VANSGQREARRGFDQLFVREIELEAGPLFHDELGLLPADEATALFGVGPRDVDRGHVLRANQIGVQAVQVRSQQKTHGVPRIGVLQALVEQLGETLQGDPIHPVHLRHTLGVTVGGEVVCIVQDHCNRSLATFEPYDEGFDEPEGAQAILRKIVDGTYQPIVRVLVFVG